MENVSCLFDESYLMPKRPDAYEKASNMTLLKSGFDGGLLKTLKCVMFASSSTSADLTFFAIGSGYGE